MSVGGAGGGSLGRNGSRRMRPSPSPNTWILKSASVSPAAQRLAISIWRPRLRRAASASPSISARSEAPTLNSGCGAWAGGASGVARWVDSSASTTCSTSSVPCMAEAGGVQMLARSSEPAPIVSAMWRSQANVEKTNESTWDQRCRKSYQAGAPRSRNEASVLIERAGSCTRARRLSSRSKRRKRNTCKC